jgi:hypothetical protein
MLNEKLMPKIREHLIEYVTFNFRPNIIDAMHTINEWVAMGQHQSFKIINCAGLQFDHPQIEFQDNRLTWTSKLASYPIHMGSHCTKSDWLYN